MSDLFFEKEIKNKIVVETDCSNCAVAYEEGKVKIDLNYGKGSALNYVTDDKGQKWRSPKSHSHVPAKFYKFKILEKYKLLDTDFLVPLYGENLLSLIKSNEGLQELCANIFQPLGYKLWLRPHEGKIDIVKDLSEKKESSMEVVISHPYTLISDTFQRLIFYLAALMS